jgi:hypothetical protein
MEEENNKEILEVASIIIEKNLAYEDFDKVISEIKKIKPNLSEDEIIEAINVAKRLLFKEEYLTEDIKKELKLWDNVD